MGRARSGTRDELRRCRMAFGLQDMSLLVRSTHRMADHPHLRVATMNVLGPDNPDWRRRQLLTETLQRLDADVGALQEVPIATAPEVIDELLGTGYHVRGFARASENGGGGALATRWPHRVVEEIDQRCTPRSSDFAWCATLLVEVDTPVGRTLVVHHKPNWHSATSSSASSRRSPPPGPSSATLAQPRTRS